MRNSHRKSHNIHKLILIHFQSDQNSHFDAQNLKDQNNCFDGSKSVSSVLWDFG